MARPRAAEYEERKLRIIDNAAELFAAQSFLGTSITDIATACGFSKSLLYHYYGSKEDLLAAVMASHIDTLEELVSQSRERSDDAHHALHALLRAFMREYAEAAAKQKVLVNELGQLRTDDRRAIVTKQRRVVDYVQSLLVAAREDLKDQPDQARAATMLLFGMINWTSNWYNPGGTIAPDDLADMAASLLLKER